LFAYFKRLLRDYFSSLLIAAIVITVCVVIFLLPTEVKDMLVMRPQVFNPLTSISAMFVHNNLDHLSWNLISFVIVIFLLHVIYRRTYEQKIFCILVLLMFTVLPILYGILFYFLFPNIRGLGLSLVNSGLLGLSIPSVTTCFKQKVKKFNGLLFIASLFFFTLYFINLPIVFRCLSAILGFIFFAVVIYLVFLSNRDRRESLIISSCTLGYLSIYLILISWLFPLNIVSDGNIVDICAHYIGLCFGIASGSIIMYCNHQVKKLKGHDI